MYDINEMLTFTCEAVVIDREGVYFFESETRTPIGLHFDYNSTISKNVEKEFNKFIHNIEEIYRHKSNERIYVELKGPYAGRHPLEKDVVLLNTSLGRTSFRLLSPRKYYVPLSYR